MIGIITFNRDTFTNPTLYGIIEALGKKGIQVMLFNNNRDSKIPGEFRHVSYADAPNGLIFPKRPNKLLHYLKVFWSMFFFIKKNKIKHLIAVDPAGLVLTGRIRVFNKNLNIHYCSFEIFFQNEIAADPALVKLKKEESKYSKILSSIIIQDEIRKELLVKENKIKYFNNWFLIPVYPIINKNYQGKKYIKADFGLQQSDTVYVHTGSVAEWSGINQIIDTIENGLAPNQYILIHSKTKFHPENPVFVKLNALKTQGKNVIIHDDVFENYNDYLSFLSCFDYGIVMYVPDDGIFTGMNIKEIGLSSGKFSAFLSQNMPVLLSPCRSYVSILADYKIGELITPEKNLSFHILNGSLKGIDASNCAKFFEERLMVSHIVDQFLSQLLNH
ncbi:hypothetical protein OC25_07135 [Pedobacter kyungheensis]|uniref:Glycosyl transferase family 1 domain-containing protein n=1 Tax=Pedobacter kyungheensis TaxID=1069985 RepID=A0A0C1FQA8_9SPHI|nr:hypothetical protein [Pedobacter kyungheensis]KIA95107.1 hypothetical protein OC25_07135 [Pedobacter kyungheensis]